MPTSRPVALAVLGRGLVDPDEPVIHADDAGLLRGLAAFETLRVYGHTAFAMDEHLARLTQSAARIRIEAPPHDALRELASLAIGAAALDEAALRLTVTGGRGAGPVTMASITRVPSDLEATRAAGIKVVALQLGIDPRSRADAPWLLGGVKSTSYAVNMAAWDEARRRGADDAVFVAVDGSVLEGPVTNLWWRRGSTLYTPALELGVLAGVTRAWVIRLAGELGYRVEEGWYRIGDMAGADEAFTSSSVRELMPIVTLDDRPIGTGRPGEAAVSLQSELRRVSHESA